MRLDRRGGDANREYVEADGCSDRATAYGKAHAEGSDAQADGCAPAIHYGREWHQNNGRLHRSV